MKKYILLLMISFGCLFLPESAEAQFNTKLQVTVRNDLGHLVEGATVTLFKKLEDYEYEENAVQTGVTDAKGRVLFYELEPRSYFMLVQKDDQSNIGRGVQTSKLEEKKRNAVDVVIE